MNGLLIIFLLPGVGLLLLLLFLLDSQKKQQEEGSDRSNNSLSPSTPASTPTSSPTPAATVTRQCLILVIDAVHGDIVESIGNKRRIDPEDCDSLYLGTKYLGVAPENSLTPLFEDAINQYAVLPGEDLSEFDAYLVKIELGEAIAGFERNVLPIKRRDAFDKLPQLPVKVSQRLRKEVAKRFDVYYR